MRVNNPSDKSTEPIESNEIDRPSQPVETDQPDQDNEDTKPSAWRRVRSGLGTVGVLLLAPIIAILLTAFVFQSYQVDGPSMMNTLQNNDRLIVWKLPRTWARITHHQYVPKRGDIIIFTQSGLTSYGDTADSKQLVKRVIGLPGDRVTYKNGVYKVYNAANPNGFDPDKTLDYGKANTALLEDSSNTADVDVTLGANQVFASGDHRADSLDSRIFGPINTSQIIGKLVVRILPLSEAERF